MSLRPCLDCGRPANGSRCPAHATAHESQRTARRGTTTARGLGWTHQRARREALARAGPITQCPQCGRPITPNNPITGEHGVPRAHGGTQITDLMCRSCNSALGAHSRSRFFTQQDR